jgi:endo-1,4-beta-xylanase
MKRSGENGRMSSRLTRRAVLAAIAGPATAAAAESGSLAAAARAGGRAFGSAFDREVLTDAAYGRLIGRECAWGTVENSLKFDWLRPRGPAADFAAADRVVEAGRALGLRLTGAALVWNDWVPPWVGRLSRAEIGALLDRHVTEVVSRYRGRVAEWHVVNEPFYPPQNRPGGFRQGAWFDALGEAHIERAFRRAAAADPQARLVLNEAFCEQDDALGRAIRPRLLALVDRLLAAGAPLHAVGFQAHLKPHLPYDDAGFADYVGQVAARGVAVQITELDVDDSHLPDDVPSRDAIVAQRCGDFLRAVMAVPALDRVSVWHLSDRYSWYAHAPWYATAVRAHGGRPDRPVRSHLYDAALGAKPAREAVARALLTRGPRR